MQAMTKSTQLGSSATNATDRARSTPGTSLASSAATLRARTALNVTAIAGGTRTLAAALVEERMRSSRCVRGVTAKADTTPGANHVQTPAVAAVGSV